MSTIVLYRGDSDKIKSFDFKKTHKCCLLGQGIYLTNKPAVAETYRTKGSSYKPSSNVVLVNAILETKGIANELALHSFRVKVLKKKEEDFDVTDLFKFEDCVQAGQIQIKETTEYINIDKSSKKARHFKYTYVPDGEKEGYLSSFEFPKQIFEDSMFNISSKYIDDEFLQMFWSNRCFKKRDSCRDYYASRQITIWSTREKKFKHEKPIETFEEFVQHVRYYSINLHSLDYERIRAILRPFGFLGFEYSGGTFIGGYGNHRAFCVWDDEFVNQYKVMRIR